jgi:hypoxanthine-guanine phosphoribosyltransferase
MQIPRYARDDKINYHAGGATSTMNVSPNAGLRQVISADQIQKRVRELGRQISDDYRGETMIALGILENSFLFMADLVRGFGEAGHAAG